MFWAPLVIASGYIGFAQYAAYLVPALAGPVPTHLLAAAVGIVTLAALYRAIPQIARTALVLGGVALVTLVAVAVAGLTHPHAPLAQTLPPTFSLGVALPALGAALVITLYDYSGYADVCALGDEVVAASRTIPRAIVISVLAVAAAYVLLNVGVVSALAPKEIAASTTVASLVAQRAFGAPFAIAVTIAVLVTAFGSTYGLLLAAARVPYAAAREGDFLAPFARLHPRGRFPQVALVAIGLLALPASLLPLDAVIAALTAGIVLVQGVAQVFALFVTRFTQPRAPFRVPLFPLPPLIALAGWVFLFFSTGPVAIAFGLGTLALGAVVFLVRARLVRSWPFAATALASLLAFACIALPHAANADAPVQRPGPAATPSFGHAVVVQRGGEPVLLLDGKPFFFWGASFFYERLPATEWRASMIALRGLGANTLDIYVPWNWHELADGDFDFDGRTNPRRNLREVLRLGKELGFAFIVRPGPVIRNEWRNGGYPAWLLTRPEYGMPLHDVLEGRYPATATLQNAHSDDAAAEWMRNQTHMRYAARWLHRALEEFRPVADRVLAVQLDDDQGAYADNQTYPAPNFARYLQWLDAQVRTVVGPVTPTFINTYAMRVPASSPVWTMGNWYQSDAYAIGEHDRIELDTTTAVLRTNHRGPLAQSEFQAGWLAQPEDPQPRAADPSNTDLALYELLAWGAHGIVDFPMQDTLAPFGWEAPFSNALYAWDAALHYPWERYDRESSTEAHEVFGEQTHGSRNGATWEFGRLLQRYGALVAETHRLADVALAYPGSSYPGSAAVGAAALARFREHIRECTDRGTPCEIVDLAYADARSLRPYTTLVVDDATARRTHAGLLAAFVRAGGTLSDRVPAEHLPGSVLSGHDATFLVASNWGSTVRHVAESDARIGRQSFYVPSFDVAARSGRLIILDARLHRFDARYRGDARATTSCDIEQWRQGLTFVASGLGCEVSGRNRGRLFSTSVEPYRNVTLRPDGGTYVVRPIDYALSDVDMGSWTPATTLAPSTTVTLAGTHRPTSAQTETYRADVFADGASDVVLQNQTARAVIVPAGGARMPVFTFLPSAPHSDDPRFAENAFDATGALRDDVLLQPPPSPTDRIARYTHSYPAGTFNRTYTVSQESAQCVRLTADVPDVVPAGARFDRYVALLPGTARLTVDERVTFAPGPQADQQRGVVLSALSTGLGNDGNTTGVLYAGATVVTTAGTLAAPRGIALVRHTVHRLDEHWEVLAVSWRPGDVEDAAWLPQRSNGTLRMVLAPGWRRVTYALARTETLAAALAFAEAERAWAGANPAPASEGGEVAKRYTQSPQKRPSESSCGFESHLPQ